REGRHPPGPDVHAAFGPRELAPAHAVHADLALWGVDDQLEVRRGRLRAAGSPAEREQSGGEDYPRGVASHSASSVGGRFPQDRSRAGNGLDLPQLRHAANLDPLDDEDVAVVVEAGAVRA